MGFLGDAWDWSTENLNPFKSRKSQSEYGAINEGSFDLPGMGERGSRLLGRADSVSARRAPTVDAFDRYGGPSYGNADQMRGGQMQLIGQLQQQAAGQGPSLAARQLRDATDRGIAQQQAMAAGAAPGQQAGAATMAAQQAGQLQSGMAGQAAQARIAEQLAARQQLAGVLGQGRGQDLQRAMQQQQLGMFSAGQENQRRLANQAAQLRTMGMNDQAIAELLRQELANARAQQQGGISREQVAAQRYGMDLQTPTGWENALSAGMGFLGLPGILGKG